MNINQLKAKIERCKAIMERTRPIWDKEFEAPGAFVTGRSNRAASLNRMVDSENNRRTKAFADYEQARKDLEIYERRLAAYEAGEVHANGQTRGDAPSRITRAKFDERNAEFMRAFVKRGDTVALGANPKYGRITIKRVSKKSVTSDGDVRWSYSEIIPLNEDGEAMTAAQLADAFKTFRETQDSTS